MQDVFLSLINEYGYLGILLLILIENVFPPIPSEAVLLFGGFVTNSTQMTLAGVIIAATFGSLFGAAVLYYVGRYLSKERLIKLLDTKWGKRTHLKQEHIEKADQWFVKYEYKAVFFCRCIPVVRSLISIPAGMSQMKPVPFFLLTAAGSVIWNTVIVLVGAFAGEAWDTGLAYIDVYLKIAMVLLAVLLAAVVIFSYKKRKNK